jgi:hypothetical protein
MDSKADMPGIDFPTLLHSGNLVRKLIGSQSGLQSGFDITRPDQVGAHKTTPSYYKKVFIEDEGATASCALIAP